MSRLEKFIKNNRDEFDDMVPPEKLWSQVEVAISKKNGKRFQVTPFLKWSAVAAALIIVMGAVVLMITNKKNIQTQSYQKRIHQLPIL